MPVTEQEQRAIVYLTKRVRDQLHGARNWDEAGIAAKVAAVAHLHLADVINAAIRAADDRTVDTPGPIANPSAHCWKERKTERPQPSRPWNPRDFCGTCGRPQGACIDHPFVSAARTRQHATSGAAHIAAARKALHTKETTT